MPKITKEEFIAQAPMLKHFVRDGDIFTRGGSDYRWRIVECGPECDWEACQGWRCEPIWENNNDPL